MEKCASRMRDSPMSLECPRGPRIVIAKDLPHVSSRPRATRLFSSWVSASMILVYHRELISTPSAAFFRLKVNNNRACNHRKKIGISPMARRFEKRNGLRSRRYSELIRRPASTLSLCRFFSTVCRREELVHQQFILFLSAENQYTK